MQCKTKCPAPWGQHRTCREVFTTYSIFTL
nr:MAG TPA: hypothetical protein [Caudoviricetes sp.]